MKAFFNNKPHLELERAHSSSIPIMASQPASAKRQQGERGLQPMSPSYHLTLYVLRTDLQLQYTTYKNTLQQIAQKIGDVEQEAEEHK